MRGARDERQASYEPGGTAGRGYGEGGATAFGQMAGGSSDSPTGGYGGARVGGFGQPGLNSQSGQGGFAPLNQGLEYGQDGGRFGPAGYDNPNFGQAQRGGPQGGEHHDEHHVHYRSWRDTQLASHDRDYARWRAEQTRRYDEDYGSWRTERHAAFSREFEGWRTGRGGQAGAQPAGGPGSASPDSQATVNPSERTVHGQASGASWASSTSASAAGVDGGFAHGANPTLARIADGQDGARHHAHDDKGRPEDPKS